ncbi:MAG TPA: response regulator [Candidatus Limnocylindrales bacterium]
MHATVLVAEDDEIVRALLVRILRGQDFQVVAARDGQEALELAGDASALDLVVTDIRMPRLDGPALVSRLRELRPLLPIVVVSSADRDEMLPVLAGPCAYVSKPFDLEQLCLTVRASLLAA